MNCISAILRIVCGMVLIFLSYSTYQRIGKHIAAGEPVQIFGHTISASSGEIALGVIGLIGVFLVVLGVVTLVCKRK